MPLQLGTAIGRGIRRSLTPVGGLLTALTVGYMLVFVGAVNSLVAAALPAELRDQASLGLTVPIGAPAAGAVMVLGLLFGMVIFLAATRAFTREAEDRGRIDASLFTRRMVRAVLSAIGANVVVTLAVTVGFVLLVVPGLFLSVSFLLVVFAIGVEDRRAVPALRRSWRLARGNRWRLLALVLVVGVGTGAIASVASLLSIVDPTLGQALSLLVSAPLGVMGYGIFADAYVQLIEMETASG